jgi:hypothetical protein
LRYEAVVATLVTVLATTASAGAVIDLATPFVAFWDQSKALPTSARVALFKQRIGSRLPEFYGASRFDPGGAAKQNRRIAAAIDAFAPIRDAFAAKASSFRRQLPQRVAAFQVAFPDFRLTVPVYLLHSLGEMDGGTRDFRGGTALLFGVDVMVKAHGDDDEQAFFDHELFHVYHARAFPGCPQVWCSLWTEGLAVAVARHLQPNASERELLLAEPAGMVAETQAHLGPAFTELDASLESSDDATIAELFSFAKPKGTLPARRGYYLGWLVAEEMARTHDLETLARLTPTEARPLIFEAVRVLRQRA